MAWDSSMTMGLSSQYLSMHSQQMGYAQQLSAMGPYSPYAGTSGPMANNMMMGGMRAAGHMGSAAMTVGGVAAGMGATAAFGAVAGTGIGIPIAAAGMMAGYAGGQMMHGAEQQNMLNMGLRANFGFRNGQGGTGFSTGQMGQIGSQLREMSHQFGPGGEITSFNELSSLATKMGQMNMAQGVRDVQSFTKKFKEMTDALKTMAKDLGTSLEGAMEFANQAKQSGVFGMKNQASFTSMARNMAVSGGLAMSEVTAMGSIGSQISRSIGGLGSQGAIGGMRTIGQVGTAMQMGILSEEDVYNATGLTGAEGRQAFAASNMNRTANFLKSGRGRRMISSMADKNGQLDMNALDQFMSGGMGVGETMGNWAERKDKIGRANFIRNEGRLRGQILEKIGGFGDAMQMMQWAQSKGVDINDMDDRSMLFAQRQLGMGRDDADQAIKMAQNMPAILAQQRMDASSDKVFQRIASRRKTQGIEGVKNRFDQARETVNGHLEKLGQDIFNEGSQEIESFLNKLAGVYVQAQTTDLSKLSRDIRAGGSVGSTARRRAFGGGGIASNSKGGLTMGGGMSSFSAFQSGTDGGFGLGTLLRGESDMSRMKKAGFDWSDISGAGADKELARRMGVLDEQRAIAANPGDRFKGLGRDNDWITRAYAMDEVKGSGDSRISSFGKAVDAKGSAELKKAWGSATAQEKVRIMATLEREQGIGGDNGIAAHLAGPDVGLKGSLGGLAGAHSQDDRAKIIGGALGTVGRASTGERLGGGLLGGLAKGALSALVPGGSLLAAAGGGFIDGHMTDLVSGGKGARSRAQGSIADSVAFKETLSDLYTGNADSRKSGRAALAQKVAGMRSGDERALYQETLKLSEYAEWLNSDEGKKASPEQRESQAKALTGMSAAAAGSKVGSHGQILEEQSRNNLEASRKNNKQIASDSVARLKSRGIMDGDGNLRGLGKREAAALGSAGQEYLKEMLTQEKNMAATGDFASEGAIDGQRSRLANMSVAQRKAVLAMGGDPEAARMNAIEAKLGRSAKRGRGAAGGVTDALGLSYGKGDLAGLSVDKIAGDLGLGDSQAVKDLIAGAQSDLAAGKKGDAIKKISQVKGMADEKSAQDERKKKEEAEKDSPLYKVMNDIKTSIHGAYGPDGTGGKVNTALANVATNTEKSKEEKVSG